MGMNPEIKWVEAWISAPSYDPYLLVLYGLADGVCRLCDPQEGGRVLEVFPSYEDACHWLNEDEYDLMEGRWSPEAKDA